MLKVEALIKYLSENNPQSSPVRLAFLNYLSHMVDPQNLVTPELLESFFAFSLDYAHWQQNREQLGEEIQDILGDHVDFANIRLPKQCQVIELENLNDVTDALQCYLNTIYKKGEKYRLILEGDKRILAIVLMADHKMCIRGFDRKMVIRHGQLEPLKKDLILHYTAELELDPEHTQRMEIAPFVTAQFQLGEFGVRGSLVRGYQHQKFFDLQGDSLATYPKLFYSIKRIEQYFLQRQSDPFYQETVSALERAIERMRLNEPESIQESVDVMARAQNILEYVFTGDKLLTLLIRDLQHTLSQRQNSRVVRTPQKVEESWIQTIPSSGPATSPTKQITKQQSLTQRIQQNPLSSNYRMNASQKNLNLTATPRKNPTMTKTKTDQQILTEDLLQDLLGSDLTS